jgi:hypothetical protein
LINGVITGVTAGAEGLIAEEELSPIPPLELAGLRFAAFFFAGFFLAALRAGFFFAAFLAGFLADFFFDAFFFDAFFFATRFLEDFFFAVFLVAFFFAAFFFAAMVKLLSMLDRFCCVLGLPALHYQASASASNEIGDRILFASM